MFHALHSQGLSRLIAQFAIKFPSLTFREECVRSARNGSWVPPKWSVRVAMRVYPCMIWSDAFQIAYTSQCEHYVSAVLWTFQQMIPSSYCATLGSLILYCIKHGRIYELRRLRKVLGGEVFQHWSRQFRVDLDDLYARICYMGDIRVIRCAIALEIIPRTLVEMRAILRKLVTTSRHDLHLIKGMVDYGLITVHDISPEWVRSIALYAATVDDMDFIEWFESAYGHDNLQQMHRTLNGSELALVQRLHAPGHDKAIHWLGRMFDLQPATLKFLREYTKKRAQPA